MKIQNEPRAHFSISQLTTYLQCPLQYYFQYELGLAWKSTPSAVAFGSSIHNAVEYLHRYSMDGSSVTLDEVTRAFNLDWAANIEQNKIRWRRAEEPAELLTKGQQLMELYYDQFKDTKPTAVELEFRLPLLDPATGLFIEARDVVGKIDVITNGGDGNSIVEVKTSGRSPSQMEVDHNLQLTLYSWAFRMLYGVPEQKILVVALVKTKTPKIEVVETHRAESDYTKLISLIEQVIKCIDQKVYYPNPVGGYGCGGCQYRSECDQWPT